MVAHSGGSLERGHYVAYAVRAGGVWCRFNDERVGRAEASEVLS